MYNYSLQSDDELFSFFSKYYKDCLGIRPRGSYWTRETVIAWCEAQSTPEAIAQRQAEWDAEEQFLQSLKAPVVVADPDPMDKYELMAARVGF